MADETKQFGAAAAPVAEKAPPAPAPAADAKPAPKAESKSGGTQVELVDIVGQPTGITVELGPDDGKEHEDDEKGIKALAGRIKGWSKFFVDGKPYEHTEMNARALLVRFGHYLEQLHEAAKK